MLSRRFALLAACLVVSAAVSTAGGERASTATARTAPSAAVTREIHRIVANLKHTKYQHATCVDEKAGSYELDCSGLVCYVLKRILPEHYRSLGKKRARAKDFQAQFAKAPATPEGSDGWRRIERILDARPGDILAWRSINPKTHSTGHVVIIDGRPVLTPDGQVRVAVIDSTVFRHGSDTRAKGQTGIGRGLMWFAVDSQGRPTGFRWYRPTGKLREHPISIGRVVPIHG